VDPATETQLVAGLRAGAADAYEAVFRAYHARLCDFANSYLHSRSDAEEIVQDLFLALWKKREELEVRTSLKAYLFTAVRNRVLNRDARARLEQRYLEDLERGELELVATVPADQRLEAREIAERVQTAMAELPPGCRRVLTMRWSEQLTYGEIAEVLGISLKGVENQLARARKTLRQRLGDVIE
jgi:RNA polymerase sigma-70 factor, ECF subfamily